VTTLFEKPFMKWGLNFIGPIKFIGMYTRNRYILVATNYAMQLVKIKVFYNNIAIVTLRLLYE
jgi:hypothetical protein